MSSYYTAFKVAGRAAGAAGTFVRPQRTIALAALLGGYAIKRGAIKIGPELLGEALAALTAGVLVSRPDKGELSAPVVFDPVSGQPGAQPGAEFAVVAPRPLQVPFGWSLDGGPWNGGLPATGIIVGSFGDIAYNTGFYNSALRSVIPYGAPTQNLGGDWIFTELDSQLVDNPAVGFDTIRPAVRWRRAGVIGNLLDIEPPYLPWSGTVQLPRSGSVVRPTGRTKSLPPGVFFKDVYNVPVSFVAYHAEPAQSPTEEDAGFISPLRPYEQSSVNVEVTATSKKPVASLGTHARMPPPKGTKERKVRLSRAAQAYYGAMAVYGGFTEVKDFVSAIYKSLPREFKVKLKARDVPVKDDGTAAYRSGTRLTTRRLPEVTKRKPTVAEMLQVLYKHWDKIDGKKAAGNIFAQEAGDALIGEMSRRRREARKGVDLGPVGGDFRGGIARAIPQLAKELESLVDVIK